MTKLKYVAIKIERYFRRWTGWSAFISVFISVLGIIYFFPSKNKISYVDHTIKIVDARSAKGITILGADGVKVESAVFATEVRVSNLGAAPADKNIVRVPLTFELLSGGRIIDASLEENAAQSYSNFKLELADEKKVQVRWDHFDPNQVVRISIVYAAEAEAQISAKLVAVGFEFVEGLDQRYAGLGTFLAILLWIVIFGVGLYLMLSAFNKYKMRPEKRTAASASFLLSLILLCLLGVCLLMMYSFFVLPYVP